MKNKIASIALLASLFTGCASNDSIYKDLDAKQIYNKGTTSLKEEKYATAIKDFTALDTKYPYGEYTEKAKLANIYALYKQNDPKKSGEALAACDRFIQQYPKHPHVDYVYYLKGVIAFESNFTTAYKLFNLNRSKRESQKAKFAFDSFKQLLERYPNSRYAYDAKMRMIHLREQMAQLEYFIAKYYIEDGAYVAAVNRIAQLIIEYPQTTSARRAVELLRQAYHKLEQPDLIQLADRVLQQKKL